MITTKPKKGDLLIAEPAIIGDVSFNRSIVLLADHTDEGSIGFILNKPLEYTINDLVPEIEATFKVYNGGPVEQDNLYFIHKIPNLIPNTVFTTKFKHFFFPKGLIVFFNDIFFVNVFGSYPRISFELIF
mgnify:CR=1 FL=1